MGKIVCLDELTINQIAAGEVIERPASVVKELVENSIDASATKVSIDIKNGGISYIRITDNGTGFYPDDMEIAFERHATSKIRESKDLEIVRTMGFRGEALASIAAIAKVELLSKAMGQEHGYRVLAEGGNVSEKEEYPCASGTTITIKELFYNTPVRYKFLKKDFTETGYIEDVVQRIAIANPNIAIQFTSNGKMVFQTEGTGKLEDVVYAIYGKEVLENIINVDYYYEDIHITGVIGKPAIARSNRSNQLFFINKRFIKDKTLSSAAEQAFKGFVTIGKHGFLILNLNMDTKKVDVNVHPTKLEVRFQEEGKVFKAVFHSIKETMLKTNLISNHEKEHFEEELEEINPKFDIKNIVENIIENSGLGNKNTNNSERLNIEEEVKKEDIKEEKEPEIIVSKIEEKPVEKLENINIKQKEKIEDLLAKNDLEDATLEEKLEFLETVENIVKEDNEKYEKSNETIVIKGLVSDEVKNNLTFEEKYRKIFGRDIEDAKKELESKTNYQTISKVEQNLFDDLEEKKPSYNFVGIVFNTYIIFSIKDEMYIMDQHAAHERLMFEKVKANYYKNEEKDSQLMLMPDIIELSNREMGIFKDNIEMFNKAGFISEEFGEKTVKLSGVPEFFMNFNTKELFLETLDEIDTVARTAKQELEYKFLATVACKAAVKAKMVLSKEEVDGLFEELFKLDNPYTCPHGRPTVIKMTKTDIEKKFSRIQ